MYAERSSVIDQVVVWTAAADGGAEEHRVLPDGCMDLIWAGGELLVAGPDTSAHVATWTTAALTGARFAAGVGPRVLGVPAHELRDRRVPLTQLWPSAQVRALAARLATTQEPGAVLERIAAERLYATEPPDPLAAYLTRQLRLGMSVDDVARSAGLSSRQLHRRSVDALGYGPKTLARILRMNRALELARTGTAPAAAAAIAGYADQAHLSRETRSLTGTTFGSLLRRPAARTADDVQER